jgi:isoquinoline 1-oxidoreductase alpha subunit
MASCTTVDLDPQTPLLYVLSDDLRPRGSKVGCGMAQCGVVHGILR